MIQKLIELLKQSPSIGTILRYGDLIELPNWYIAAGAIPTVVWNRIVANEPEKFLHDIDIVYYDDRDISEMAEAHAEKQVKALFPEIPHKIDVKNQARVHTWYRDKTGKSILQYPSVEAAIDMWLSVTAVGIRPMRGRYKVYAPYGLDDLFSMEVKPNRRIISAEHYRKKAAKWKSQWPELTVFEYEFVGSDTRKGQ
ncbi:MAG: nucleotidyltransferase family protein [Proteobacteria bacterium]|nr:nucleotidyltransferase family protein [Pseudomonadota bacterium]MBU4471953.1 nucleotidyltransferase family protein [Pseudomonadota bacterium]MCG2753420.1 nucleotidyltransferase family protein [Desulfobacteraceae bacterium]